MENNDMTQKKIALITGADGGMGSEITRAVAQAGYHVIMASCRKQKAEAVRRTILHEGDYSIEVRQLDLSSFTRTQLFAEQLVEEGRPIALLMNCAGTMQPYQRDNGDDIDWTVSVNYLAPYLLTRKLLPLMGPGSRIVNMVSCTYRIGRLDFDDFFIKGRKGRYWRIPVYSNTKLALLLFTLDLAEKVKDQGIVVNAADPGIVSTDMITMHMWFDPLTDLFFRPFIKTPRQGADTAIRLLLDEDLGKVTGQLFVNGRVKPLSDKYRRHPKMKELWDESEFMVYYFLYPDAELE